MYEIKAKLIASRVNVSRAGARARRLPSIVLGTGAVLRIAPGRSVKITPAVYESNKTLLDTFSEVIEVIDLRPKEDVVPPQPVPPEPVEVEPTVEPEPTLPEPEVVEPVQELAEETPAIEPVIEEEPKPKKRRSRKKKKVEEDA